MKIGKNLIKKGHICHSKTFRFYSKAVEIYEKILVRKSRRDSQIMEFKIFLASFNLSNTQVIVNPSTILSACIGLLQGYAHGRSPILIPLVAFWSHLDNTLIR